MWLLRPAHKHIGQDTLSEHLDGRLHGRRLERVERQLEECDACRQELAELQATVSMMRQLPMEAPRSSFVMSAPPSQLARARPQLALRAPNWVYAGAASVAALALAVTISVDATGGLSSDPLRQEAAATALAPAADLEPVTGVSGPTPETAATSGEEAAPPSLAAAAPAVATADQSAQGEPAIGGATAFEAARTAQPTSAPESQDGVMVLVESAAPAEAVPAPETGDASSATDQPAEPELFDGGAGGGIPIWWRVLEAAAGALALVFLAGLVLRWRAGRRDLA